MRFLTVAQRNANIYRKPQFRSWLYTVHRRSTWSSTMSDSAPDTRQEPQKECEHNEKKTLLLIGGGHAHVQVITDPRFGEGGSQGMNVRRVLLSESRTSVYSGLVPAVIANLTSVESCEIDVEKLCDHYGVHFVHGRATSIDAQARRVTFEPVLSDESTNDSDEIGQDNGENKGSAIITQTLRYSVLSMNVGSVTPPVKGMNLFPKGVIVPTRPIAGLVRSLQHTQDRDQFRILIVGAGHAGIELALAVHARFPSAHVTVAGKGTSSKSKKKRRLDDDRMKNGWNKPKKAIEMAAAQMRKAGVTFLEDYTVTELHPPGTAMVTKTTTDRATSAKTAVSSEETQVGFDVAVLATGAAPRPLLKRTDLPLTDDGWMAVNASLQSLHSDGTVFAAGDCISITSTATTNQLTNTVESILPLPKAGVFAVRQGPVLAHNLWVSLGGMSDAAAESTKLRDYVPQTNFLSLISTGDGRAIGTKYGVAFSGTWVFRLKMYIDEAWQNRFRVCGEGKSDIESISFSGTALEAAAVLIAADDIRPDDCFDTQWAILKRMDADKLFRDAVLESILTKERGDR